MYFVTLLILVYSTKEYKKIYNKFYQILKSYTSSWFFNSLHFQHFLKVFLKWITNKLPIVVQLLSCVCLWPHGLQHTGFLVLHHLLELARTHVHWVSDAIQPSRPLSSSSPPAFIFPSNRVFSSESALLIRWLNHWSFSFSISPSNENIQGWFSLGLTGLISL